MTRPKAKQYPVEVRLTFDLENMNEAQQKSMWAADEALRGGVGLWFDSDGGEGERGWSLDWSLKGPLTVTASGTLRDLLEAVEELVGATEPSEQALRLEELGFAWSEYAFGETSVPETPQDDQAP